MENQLIKSCSTSPIMKMLWRITVSLCLWQNLKLSGVIKIVKKQMFSFSLGAGLN